MVEENLCIASTVCMAINVLHFSYILFNLILMTSVMSQRPHTATPFVIEA